MTEPLRFSVEVGCPVAHAFTVWTSGIGTWWPADHTVTGSPDLRVVLEGRSGGRIYRLQAEGALAVQRYLQQVWGDAGARFRLFADNTEPRSADD